MRIVDEDLNKSLSRVNLQGSVCCGYGKDGKATSGYDCVVIKGRRRISENCRDYNLSCC